MDRTEQDERRTEWLRKEGITVIRFSADDVENRSAAVVATIAGAAPPSTA